MKAKTLMMLALCLTTTAAKAQVVYGDDEKNYARTTGSSMPMSATNHNLQQQPSILMETHVSIYQVSETTGLPLCKLVHPLFLVRQRDAETSMTRQNTPWCLVLVNGTLVSSEHVLCTRDFSLPILTRNL